MRVLNNEEDSLFYFVAIFYQTRADARDQPRGGNRAELILSGDELFYRMPTQVDSFRIGHIVFNK